MAQFSISCFDDRGALVLCEDTIGYQDAQDPCRTQHNQHDTCNRPAGDWGQMCPDTIIVQEQTYARGIVQGKRMQGELYKGNVYKGKRTRANVY